MNFALGKTKKYISLLLATIILLSFLPMKRGAIAAEGNRITLNSTRDTSYSVSFEAKNAEEYAVRFNSGAKVMGISIYIDSYKVGNFSFDVKVYKWEGSYRASTANDPVTTGYRKGTGADPKSYFDIQFADSVDAGEYIVTLGYHGSSTILKLTYGTPRSKFYIDGFMEDRSLLSAILCDSNDPMVIKDITDGFASAVVPPKYEYPSDSAVISQGITSDAWYMVDGLERVLPSYSEVGNKKERFVGMFYWTWHANFSNGTPLNVNSFMKEHPDAKNDYNHPAWPKDGTAYFWNEPVYGYYTTTDAYVLRKQAELFTDAGVDVLIFDCTNGTWVWEESTFALLETFKRAREEGVNTPQISFILNFAPNENTYEELEFLYKNIYSAGLYQDLWFYWDGKPLIMGYGNVCNQDSEISNQMAEFFTFRYPEASYFSSDNPDRWGWLSNYPQPLFGRIGEDGRPEQMTVGVAQNCDGENCTAMNGVNIQGRGFAKGDYSYKYLRNGSYFTVTKDIENAYYYGLNFQQQWDRAIECDPDFVFVTGWNEWTAGRHKEWGGYENAFPDEFDDEFSRDIEPTKGDLKDYFYTQLVANVRRYKGMENKVPKITFKTIDINDFSSWSGVESSFNHYTNNTYERNVKSYGGVMLKNNTMRNDIDNVKIAYDKDNFYFYASTVDTLTPSTDNAWMRLFLDTNQEGTVDNWEGFEYVINRTSPNGDKCIVEKSCGTDNDGNWLWNEVGYGTIAIKENEITIVIPREMLGIDNEKFMINFKWSDNMQSDGDIMDFYVNGDVAPGSRFAFSAVSYEIRDIGGQTISTSTIFIIAGLGAALLIAATVIVIMVVKKRKTKGL